MRRRASVHLGLFCSIYTYTAIVLFEQPKCFDSIFVDDIRLVAVYTKTHKIVISTNKVPQATISRYNDLAHTHTDTHKHTHLYECQLWKTK